MLELFGSFFHMQKHMDTLYKATLDVDSIEQLSEPYTSKRASRHKSATYWD